MPWKTPCLAIALCLLASRLAAETGEFVLVEAGAALAPIIVTPDAPAATRQAAEDLAGYLEKMSGARVPVLSGPPGQAPAGAVWVGYQPALTGLFPGVVFDFSRPEEILIACNGRHLAILGRDRVVGDTLTESGTANAVYTFIQRDLGVRWFWPGTLGEDVPRRETIAFAPFEYRFHPVIRQRNMRRRRHMPAVEAQVQAWWRFQRAPGSLAMSAGHAFTDWWEKYHESNPEYFALRPDGTRTPRRSPSDVKLCMANPGVWARWLENAGRALEDDPARVMVSASPNDGGDFCVCDECRALNHPDAAPGVLTDQHVKVWNIMARELRERFPGRDVYVGAWAYSAYREPPLAEALDDRVAIGYVGHFPLSGGETREREKNTWRQWAGKAATLVFRPNLFHYSGGMLGLPTTALTKTVEDFRFLAENSCAGLDVDFIPEFWSTQGPQHYLMVQLSYDPLQDGEELLADYWRRAFGPAAGNVAGYFGLMEAAHDRIVEWPDFRHSSGRRYWMIDEVYHLVYTGELLDQADTRLAAAADAAAGGPEVYRRRVEFVRAGLTLTRLQMNILGAMTRVRASKGTDAAAVARAIELCAARDELFARHGDDFAFNVGGFRTYVRNRLMEDYLGPPSGEFRQAAGLEPAPAR